MGVILIFVVKLRFDSCNQMLKQIPFPQSLTGLSSLDRLRAIGCDRGIPLRFG